MPGPTRTGRDGKPDATGLALAQAVQDAVQPDTVILFGSRARGDHRPDSDVDLLIVCRQGEGAPLAQSKRTIRDYFGRQPWCLPVDVVTMSQEKFDYCRRAKNHVAGQALRDGVVMSGERLNYSHWHEEDYPDNWPDVKERLRAAYRQLNTFNRMMESGAFPQEDYGFHAQQAVENAMKAWVSAAGLEYRKVHDLDETAQKLLDDPVENRTLAAAQLRLLLDYTRFELPDSPPDSPGEYGNWLTRYAVGYRYEGTAFRMTGLDQVRFQEEINLAAHGFINRAHELTGTGEDDLYGEQPG